MEPRVSSRAVLVVFTTTLVCLAGGPTPTSSAQDSDSKRAPGTGGARVFKGVGQARIPAAKAPAEPSPLSMGARKNLAGLVEAVPGTLYVKLTASQPTVSDKGALVFVKADIVEGGQNHARWRPKDKAPTSETGYLYLWLRSNANRRYLIDCSVEEDAPLTNPRSWNVVGPDNTTQTWDASAKHLVFVLDAATSGWYSFSIFGVNRWWFFYSCEVTNL